MARFRAVPPMKTVQEVEAERRLDAQLASGMWLHEATIRMRKDLARYGMEFKGEQRLRWSGKRLLFSLGGSREMDIAFYASVLMPLETAEPKGY